MVQVIATDDAPRAIGPYSQALKYAGFVFVSGQIPIDPKNGQLLLGSVKEQTAQVLKNLQAILNEAGTDLKKVLKTTVYIKDMNDFDAINQVYGEFFQEIKPARACVEVARLPKDVSIEIDAIAAV